MMDTENIRSLGEQMIEEIFRAQDRKLIEDLQKLRALEETKENLAKVSGICNPGVLDKFVEMNITPDLVASLWVVPLIEVAWADGDVDEKEKQSVLGWVRHHVEAGHDVDEDLLNAWLTRRPPPRMLTAWEHWVTALCGTLPDTEREALRSEIMTQSRSIAETTGGFLGLGSKVSADEHKMLARLDAAFAPPAAGA